MAMANNHYNFVPDPHTSEYLAINECYDDRSSSPSRKFWPFNRSRSSSPNTNGQPNLNLDTSLNTVRSRKSSANSNSNAVSPSGSASSFVVRSVIRNPGGVSLPSSPVNDQRQAFFSQNSRQHSPSSGARRMTLEDSDDDVPQPAAQQLQYRRSKSKPLGAVTSLGVPPGGPGGGVGYGTSRSSNDGRPESSASSQPSPYYRPASPSGSITAGDFHRGAKERGRPTRKSGSGSTSSNAHSGLPMDKPRSGSAQPSASSPFNANKPVARITAGPKSLVQQHHEDQHHQSQAQQQQGLSYSRGPSPAAPRPMGMSGPRQFPGAQPPSPGYGFHPQQHSHAPRSHSAGPPPFDQRGDISLPPTLPLQHPPTHESQDDPPTRSRRFSFGIIGRQRKDSDKGHQISILPGVAPLDGLPSPVDIPYGRSSHSPLRFDGGAETDYSRANSPFGSVSPVRAGGSPNSSGLLSNLMGNRATADERSFAQQQQQRYDDGVPRSCSPAGGSNLAGKWFKGVFGRSPRSDEKDPNYAATAGPYAVAYGARDAEDEAAYAQKLASMRQARHIVDEERDRFMLGPVTPTAARVSGAPGSAQRYDPHQDREFRPKQVVDSDAEAQMDDFVDDDGLDAALEFELGRKKSPPGRKPVPAYLPAAKPFDDNDANDSSISPEEPLTPAQRIIHETRSKHLAREQIEAQRKRAVTQQQEELQRFPDPRQIVGANAELQGPQTPPKTRTEPALSGHPPRIPSGAHQITREPPKGASSNPAPQASGASVPVGAGQRSGSTLSPGSGPMPADLPLRDALQEMMVRFYRFERYSVPLIRSLETRLLDIERDAMLANNPQARNGTRASVASNSSAEMDRWVNQMTGLMKHEVGQLKAATREIKESRELVASVARHASASGPGVALSMSVSSFGSLTAITPSASQQQPQGAAKPSAGEATQKERVTNVSSSTFESAVPRNLVLPVGAKPALDKDQTKFSSTTSPTKANFGFASESGKEHKELKGRDRSVSPNGRPRYTSVLSQPLVHGRISPGPSVERTEEHAEMKRDVSVEDRLKALMEGKNDGSIRTKSNSSFATAPTATTNTDKAESGEAPEEMGDQSGASDIAAALAAIDATSATAAAQHEKKSSEQTVDTARAPSHVPVAVAKTASNSSSLSGAASVEEPLTPTVELGAEPTSTIAGPHFADGLGTMARKTGSEGVNTRTVAYLSEEPKPVSLSASAASSPVKTHFASTSSPTPTSGRISPNKLFAHKFAAATSSSSAPSASAGGSPKPKANVSASAGAKLGLVEKKRFTLPAPTPAASLGSAGVTTTIAAREAGKLSRTPSYSMEESAPTSAAFSGLAKVKPVGHTATLRERVAFFDSAK